MADKVLRLVHEGRSMADAANDLYTRLYDTVYEFEGAVMVSTVLGALELVKAEVIKDAEDM